MWAHEILTTVIEYILRTYLKMATTILSSHAAIPLIILVLVVRSTVSQYSANNEDSSATATAAGNTFFIPPKISFTSANHNALQWDDKNRKKGVVWESHVSVQAPWKVFQSASDIASAESIRRRSGPLLTLFPDRRTGTKRHAKHVVLSPEGQRAYLVSHEEECRTGDDPSSLLMRYDLLAASPTSSNLAIELWKYCALYAEGGVYVDPETVPLMALGDVLEWEVVIDGDVEKEGAMKNSNYAVTSASRASGISPTLPREDKDLGSGISDAVYAASSRGTGRPVAMSSFIAVADVKNIVMRGMIEVLVAYDVETLVTDALLLPRTFMSKLDNSTKSSGEGDGINKVWGTLRQRCSGAIKVAPLPEDGGCVTLRRCPSSAGYCCEVLDPTSTLVFLLSRQSLVPNQVLPSASSLPLPYNSNAAMVNTMTTGENVAFLSTVREQTSSPLLSSFAMGDTYSPGTSETTPNVYELLSAQGALPNQVPNRQACMDCLREKKASDCNICGEKCTKFCERICELEVHEKPVRRVASVAGPRYRKDPERFIPRIVHQVSLCLVYSLLDSTSELCSSDRPGLSPSRPKNIPTCPASLNLGNDQDGNTTFGTTPRQQTSCLCTFRGRSARRTIPFFLALSRLTCSGTAFSSSWVEFTQTWMSCLKAILTPLYHLMLASWCHWTRRVPGQTRECACGMDS